MEQMQKRFTAEQVRSLLKRYRQGAFGRAAIEEILWISKSRFFVLMKNTARNLSEFSLVL
jgi:Leu/Phe-tRNA-protein transferase